MEGAKRRSPIARPFRLAAGRLTQRPAIGGCQYLIGHPCYHVISNTVKIVIVNKKIISERFLGSVLFSHPNEMLRRRGTNSPPFAAVPYQLACSAMLSAESLGERGVQDWEASNVATRLLTSLPMSLQQQRGVAGALGYTRKLGVNY